MGRLYTEEILNAGVEGSMIGPKSGSGAPGSGHLVRIEGARTLKVDFWFYLSLARRRYDTLS